MAEPLSLAVIPPAYEFPLSQICDEILAVFHLLFFGMSGQNTPTEAPEPMSPTHAC
jgi:hypothetical protein